MDEPTDQEVCAAARGVLASVGVAVDGVDDGAAGDEPQLVACVQIGGAWIGGIEVACPLPLARASCATMSMIDPAALSPADLHDAFGEIANMIGGGIKSALRGHTTLSLPIVVEGAGFVMSVRSTRVRSRVRLRCAGGAFTITLFEQE